MKQYLDSLRYILQNGVEKDDRTKTGTLSIFGLQSRYDLSQGFPLITTKKVHLKSIIHELLWFLRGETNIAYLKQHKVRIWDEWADKNGDLGPVYGRQWRHWQNPDGTEVDQVAELIKGLKEEPYSRRHILTAWNPSDIKRMSLPPCHTFIQFYVAGKTLSCQLYQRSADMFLGVPFNIASYSLLTMMTAQVSGLHSGEFIHCLGDAHLYLNHVEQAKEQLSRTPRMLPKMWINPEITSIFDFTYDDFQLSDYNPYPHIKARVAV